MRSFQGIDARIWYAEVSCFNEESGMAIQDHDQLRRIDRAIKIEQLKEEAAFRGEFHDDGYWEMVYDYDYAPWTTDYELLQEEGVDLPDGSLMDDDCLTDKLWEIIEALAVRRVFLMSTDHLSERELYEVLVTEILLEPRRDAPLDEDSAFVYDVVGSGSDEDLYLFLKYYATEEDRKFWGKEISEMPARVQPPYDRDRFLPGENEL